MNNDITIEQLNKEITNLKDRLSLIENESFQLDRNLDNQSKDIVSEVVSDRILDIAWDKYFYFFSTFEGADGWDVVSEAIAPVNSGGLVLQTTAVSNDVSSAYKTIKFQKVMSFDEESRFRTILYLAPDTSASNIEYALGVGIGLQTPVVTRYGFRLNENKLYGISSNGINESIVELITLPSQQGSGTEAFVYILEARNYPGNRIDYFVSEVNDAKLFQRGSISTNLPSGNTDMDISFYLKTKTTTAKKAYVDFCEYIQIRPIR